LKYFLDLLQASTGSGKTLAFLIPIFEKLLKDADSIEPEQIKALIISPTRELAAQIYKVALKLSESVGKISVKSSFGKSSKKDGEFTHNGQNILVDKYNLDYDSWNAG
jgi:superfamily II DNA/RNA helicase